MFVPTAADLVETTLFVASPGDTCHELTPRAAFQSALHGRASILDLRTGAERARDGDLPAYLSLGGRDGHREVIAMVGDDGLTLGLPVISGGFAGWLSSGMPVSRRPLSE